MTASRTLRTTLWLLVLSACPSTVPCPEAGGQCDDAGSVPPDVCNSREEALSDPQCALTLGQARLDYISFSQDQDWFLIQLPGDLTARSLLHVTGGYGAPNTAVNLSLNVLREDGQHSLVRKVDKHGQAAPKPIDIVLPFSESNARLLLLVGDEGGSAKPAFDVRNPYSITVEVLNNPDLNEPNDLTPTSVPLTANGAELVGQATGYLATDNDVDRFGFTAPAGRKVIYLKVSAPALTPPPPYRLSYTLLDPAGQPVSEGVMANEFLPVDLVTARLATAGEYTLVIQGFRSPNQPATVGGDLRLQYTVDLRIMDDLDVHEPNDTPLTAKVLSLAATGAPPVSATGRLGFVPDPDWYAVDLPALNQASTLRFKLTPSASSGRFPPLSEELDRQLRVLAPVTQGATAADRLNACKTEATVCPKAYEGAPTLQALVESLCQSNDPPLCLFAERNEHPAFASFRNGEGVIPVPAHGATVRYYLVVQDQGLNWADDRDYQLTVEWLADPDEDTRSGLPEQTQTQAIQASMSYPEPPGGSDLSGTLSFGHGRLIHHDFNQGEGVRAPNDYDALSTDQDRYELTFPAIAAPEDRAWALQWEVDHLPDGGVPGELALELEFCNGAGCPATVKGLVLAYDDARLAPWYSSAASDRQVLWRKQVGPTATTITAEPAGCFCFEPRFVQGGKLFVKVGAVDRRSSDPISYRLRTSFADYPQSYTVDGGTRACPVAATGPSCKFTNAP